MIPNKIAVTYCAACEGPIREGGLCTMRCQYDTSTRHDRPIVVVTYWRRDDARD